MMFWSYSTRTGYVVSCENESEAVLTAVQYTDDIVFEAELVPFDRETEPTRWWRVLDVDGSIWCETSDEDEARDELRESHIDNNDDLVYGEIVPGRKLQRLYIAPEENKWKDEK